MSDIFDKLGGDIFDKLAPSDVRAQIAERKASPPAAAMGDPRAKPESALERYAPFIAHPIDTGTGIAKTLAGGVQALAHPIDAVQSDWNARGAAYGRIAKRGIGSDDPENLRDAAEMIMPMAGPAFAGAGRQMNSTDTHERAQGTGSAIALTSGPEIAKSFVGDAVTAIRPTRAGAVRQYAKVLDPKGADTVAADKAATSLISERKTMANPARDLPDYADAKANAIDTKTPILNRPAPAPVAPIIKTLEDARAKLFDSKTLPDGTVQRTVRHGMQPTVDGLSAMIDEIKTKATDASRTPRDVGTLPNETLANLHKDLNYAAGKGGGFDPNTRTNPERWSPDAHGANAVREVVNSEPEAAAANADKSGWVDVKHLKPAEAVQFAPRDIRRVVAKAGATTVAGAVGGPIAAKVVGGLLGAGEVGRAARDVMASPAYQTWSAVKKAQFADAVKAGDAARVAEIIGTAAPAAPRENYLQNVMRGAQ